MNHSAEVQIRPGGKVRRTPFGGRFQPFLAEKARQCLALETALPMRRKIMASRGFTG